MLRIVAGRMIAASRSTILPQVTAVRAAHGLQLSDEEQDKNFIEYFERKDIDDWEIRQIMNRLAKLDLVPEPPVICSALRACRRLNDFAIAIRFLELVKFKCGKDVDKIWPYVMQEIKPTLDELGINTIEEMGYDKPELALQSVYDIH